MSESDELRLFCALDLPDHTVALIEAWQRDVVGEGSPWRPVAAESLHITVAFLGDRTAAEAKRVGEMVAGFDPGPGPILGRLEPEPVPLPRRKPRLLALSVVASAIGRLQAEVAERLAGEGLLEPDPRPFWPHVTVLKRRPGDGPRRVNALPEPGADAGMGEDVHAFGSVRLALYRSEIRPGGSHYTRLAERDLPPKGG